MSAMDAQTSAVVVTLLVLALMGFAAWLFYRQHQSHRLEHRYGSEYHRIVEGLGSRSKAEAELKARERRVKQLNIVPLMADDANRFTQSWKALQARFVDDPKGVVGEADQLVRELMARRGYPMADFEHRAADISVDHPAVVDHYRAAQAIAERARRNEASTEDLRKAVVHYRALFDDLLEVVAAQPGAEPARPIEARP